jgi:hypothetical protein
MSHVELMELAEGLAVLWFVELRNWVREEERSVLVGFQKTSS